MSESIIREKAKMTKGSKICYPFTMFKKIPMGNAVLSADVFFHFPNNSYP